MDMVIETKGAAWRRPLAMALGIVAVLLVPLVAMRFTDEVRWTALDFVAATMLLGGAAIGGELVMRSLRGTWRVVACAGVLACAALLWAQGAVGIF